jgi:dimethylamine/trimethylamine dehydrogenase
MGEEWRRGWHPERIAPAASARRALVVGAGPAGLELARALGQRGYEVAVAEAGERLGGRVLHEARLPGLASWMRVVDHRVQQLRLMPRVHIYLASRLSADDVLGFGFDTVFTATGSRWRKDGLGREHRRPLVDASLAGIFNPDEVLAGATLQGPVLIYDDDHYVMAGARAERLARQGLQVHYMTPGAKVSEWTEMTMEQPRIQARLLQLGVHIHASQALVAVQAAAGGLAVTARCIYTGRETELACASLVPVTMRDPEDRLFRALQTRQPEWADAGIRQVTLVGDALAPGTVAAAVHGGHLAARELDAAPLTIDAVPFRREGGPAGEPGPDRR